MEGSYEEEEERCVDGRWRVRSDGGDSQEVRCVVWCSMFVEASGFIGCIFCVAFERLSCCVCMHTIGESGTRWSDNGLCSVADVLFDRR